MMRILTLIEDSKSIKELHSEQGLSFYIELNDNTILMDTGASDKFISNAERLGADLSDLSGVVISHNHHDHTGGLEPLLKLYPSVKVFAKKEVDRNYYRKVGMFNAAICWNRHILERYKGNFVLFTQFQEICKGFYVMGCEVHEEKNILRDKRLLMKEGKKYVPDDFKHEIFAVAFPHIDKYSGNPVHEKGCVVISSCSHCGIVNILETVKLTWHDTPILGVIGGFHLQDIPGADEAFLKRTAEELSRLSDGCVYTCHCTGEKAYERLKFHMEDQIQTLKTGEELSF
jgi:7,8-dihydropterin-6-yl-methyl-4-(beta-D-ribofuranosyl)aminobenzene 5'-phosphate synthase